MPASPSDDILTRADLLAGGLRPRQITAAVRAGRLRRLRRNRYAAVVGDDVARAVTVGGRLACVSLLARAGVFVFDGSALHIHLERSMTRLRSPDDGQRRLSGTERRQLVLHWSPLHEPAEGLGAVSLPDAVAQAVRCQTVRAAVATVDSVLHLGLMTQGEMRDVLRGLPRRYGVVLRLADRSAESGPETFLRLILRQLGLQYRTQVWIDGVGRVDFLVEGWLIVECDSRSHHEGWASQRADRRRDLEAGARGYTTIRPLAEDLFHHREAVVRAIRGLTRHRRG